PQLAAARAMLEAYRADLKKARLNLERTILKAPFDGRVSQENVGLDQFVSPGQVLATLYSIEAAEVVVPLEDRDTFWFHIPGFSPGRGPGGAAKVVAQMAGRTLFFEGRVVRTEAQIDPKTRMLPVVIRVQRPYAKKPPLSVGLFVTVHIQGTVLPESVLIPRSSLHQGNIVWMVDRDGHLHFQKVTVARFQGTRALIRNGLKTGDRIVISPMEAVTDGMTVRTMDAEEHDLS
ncbi:MAG: efflux RND transporter periplasmic adaptor subunit, partial [Deltaproteobacteria bacterium]|nr:efflux RND transporter periplasmic adaptor subunit [Deltaproteobacteria bacterium]